MLAEGRLLLGTEWTGHRDQVSKSEREDKVDILDGLWLADIFVDTWKVCS